MTIQELREKNMIIFEGISGSHAYGIATENSDRDIRGVFIIPLAEILRGNYVEQVSDEKNDIIFYELGRFFQLLESNNPNILEILNLPDDCIIQEHSTFSKVRENSTKFLSKICKNSFGGYAYQQISKARGLNKKIVRPFDKERKGVLDFCYVPDEDASVPVKDFLEERGMHQEHCGLVSLPHMRYVYAVYYDRLAQLEKKVEFQVCSVLNYKGIANEDSNEVLLSSVPKGETPSFYMYFNADAYSIYCREYKEYWEWAKKRNPDRYNTNMEHGKGYDGKNLAHCHRLLDMAIEIAQEKGVIVRRKNREDLLEIRSGKREYDTLVSEAETKIEKMKDLFEKSKLPDSPDREFTRDLLEEIRREVYLKM
jgi:hypothetical protein